MEGELVPVGEVRYDLSMARAPKQVLAEAQEAAKSLQSVISQSPTVVKFNGKTYLAFEHWQVLGRFYGVTARIVKTDSIDMDGVKGFIARAEAVNIQTGQVVSAAESMCMNDEQNWAKKPLFQLRSMAQTRACAKSLRNVLAWVVVLAGYEPSVAEEMTGEEGGGNPPIQPPQRKEPNGEAIISDAQRKRFYAIWKGAGKSEDEVRAKLKEAIGSDNSANIPKGKYEALCAWAQGGDAQE